MIKMMLQVVSVAERKVTSTLTTTRGNYFVDNYERPSVNISMSLDDPRVYNKDERVTVRGLLQHFNFSRGEAFNPKIRLLLNCMTKNKNISEGLSCPTG